MKRFLLTLCSVLLVTACASSQPQSLNYYLLDTSDVTSSSPLSDSSKPLVLLGQVEVSEFLQQSSLVLRLGNHQLYQAHNHVWAEPLSNAIPKALLKDLRYYAQDYHFERDGSEWSDEKAYRLKVQIDQFYPTAQQQVVLTGRYWVQSSAGKPVVAKDFQFTKRLTEDGYAHSVAEMRGLLTGLAKQLSEVLE